MSEDVLSLFHPLVAEWFRQAVGRPTEVQQKAWPEIAAGAHVLASAPTGTGKTLAAFLWGIDRLVTGAWAAGKVRILYVSPLKALNNDIQRNLLTPLAGLGDFFSRAGSHFPEIRVLTRSGDTPSSERRRMLRPPAGDPHHHPGEPEPHPLLAERPLDAGRRCHRHPGRDPRGGRNEAGNAPRDGGGEAGAPVGGVPADRALRHGAAALGGCRPRGGLSPDPQRRRARPSRSGKCRSCSCPDGQAVRSFHLVSRCQRLRHDRRVCRREADVGRACPRVPAGSSRPAGPRFFS